jgi:hypothetical protein
MQIPGAASDLQVVSIKIEVVKMLASGEASDRQGVSSEI